MKGRAWDLGQLLAAETIGLPASFLLWIYLTRRLGPTEFGEFTVTVTVVIWVEITLVAFLGRTTVRVVARARDWRSPTAALLRRSLAIASLATALIALAGVLVAQPLEQSYLAWTLPLLALEVPLILLAEVHRNVLVARGRNALLGWVGTVRWVARLLLMAGLVRYGYGLWGALIGSVLAGLVELAAARIASGAALTPRGGDLAEGSLAEVTPWVASTIGMRLIDALGIWAALLGGASAQVLGWYGAAQSATRASHVLLTLMPPLHAELVRNLRDEDHPAARRTTYTALRLLLSVAPIPIAVACAAPQLVLVLFGPAYAGSAPFLSILILGAYGFVMKDAVHTILACSGKAPLTWRLTAPLIPAAVLGHLLLIPALGALGAALVTATCLILGALIGVVLICRSLAVPFPWKPLAQSLGLAVLTAYILLSWPLDGWKLFAELGLVAVLAGALALRG